MMDRKSKKNSNETIDQAGRDEAGESKWSCLVGPRKTVLLAENAPRCIMVIKNLGPAGVVLHNGDRRELNVPPGEIRVLDAYGQVAIQNQEEGAATALTQYMPLSKR